MDLTERLKSSDAEVYVLARQDLVLFFDTIHNSGIFGVQSKNPNKALSAAEKRLMKHYSNLKKVRMS